MIKDIEFASEQKNNNAYQIELRRLERNAKKQRKKETIKTITVITILSILAILILIKVLTPIKACGYEYDTCDSLWELATEHCPNRIDKRDFVDEVMKLNGMNTATVYENRLYQYPVYE